MDAFNFCWMTLFKESKKCCVFFDKNTCNVRNDIDENFNKPINRIAYLYKFGSFNISFFHQCFMEFFTKSPDSLKVINNFCCLKNLNICSMSAGPGTDIIGLLYSLFIVNKPLGNSVAFKIISRHGAWRNLVTEMMSSSVISVPKSSTCKLIECDFLKELSKKAKDFLKAADILLMCNSFSSSITPEKVISNTLQNVIQLLKPGALVFFIDSKEKSTYFKEMNSSGSFLCGPVEVTLENMSYNEEIAETVGVKPLCSGRSLFAVWQKLFEVKSEMNPLKVTENSLTVDGNQHLSSKLINCKKDVNAIQSQIFSLSNMTSEFSSDTNISSNDSIALSSQVYSTSISSQTTEMREKLSIVSDNSACFSGHAVNFSETNFNSCTKNISPASVNATDSLLRKKYAPQSRSGPKKKENNGDNMGSLMKNFENLITKLEGLISSHDSLKNSHVNKKLSSDDQQHHQNIHKDHRSSVKPSEFNGNTSTCCHSVICCNDTNVCDHQCSMSVANNLYRTLPQEGPCIVIPLQNLPKESLTQILSIVSQSRASTSKASMLPNEKCS